MLTPRQIELVKATVPVLREHGVALTSHFYKRMLGGNPELKNVFNQAHQARGAQQKALAAAVLAYAENIENPGVLLAAVKHIANKHCTIGIRAEQYPIVGKHLLASIREVLGAAATDELIDAWGAAYGQLADLLIGVENGIYNEQANEEGGWSGWRPFRVEKIVQETPNVKSFYLKPTDKGQVPEYKSGQYVSVRAFLPEIGLEQPRQYSLSRASANHRDGLRLSIKRVDATADAPAGRMTTHLHNSVKEGDIIDVSAPAGVFYLEKGTNPVVLASAGIGITPIYAMLEEIANTQPDRPVLFLHVTQNAENFALVNDCHEQFAKLKNLKTAIFFTQAGEKEKNCTCPVIKFFHRPTAADVASLAPAKNADVYMCGPAQFMADLTKDFEAAGVAKDHIHAEFFGTGNNS